MKTENSPKKPYEKPKVTRFPLRPEEAVLGFCKTNTTGGLGAPGACGSPTPCFPRGS
ncbi:MAG TPA: hypothetical protein VN181_13350 [Thermoanaerobaculia bacterium]|nr:hypothetical protein [Thermoanaerobaculia bacterium]